MLSKKDLVLLDKFINSKFQGWMYEFTYYLFPTMDKGSSNFDQIHATMKNIDFTSDEAKAFLAGLRLMSAMIREGIVDDGWDLEEVKDATTTFDPE